MKILIFDIETSPMKGYFWGNNLYEQQILEVEEDTHIMCFAYQWNHLDTVHVVSQPDFGAFKRDKKNDVGVVKALWKLLDEADVVIAHNGRKFDIKKANARFLILGMPPPSPYKVLDTLEVARKRFALPSNKLDEIGRQILGERKLAHTGKKLWFDCMKGDEEAWDTMKEYNIQDVALLKATYDKFLPWIENHPNWNLDGDRPDCCPNCGSGRFESRGSGYTRTTEFKRYFCKACYSWFRGGNIKQVKMR